MDEDGRRGSAFSTGIHDGLVNSGRNKNSFAGQISLW
jgi:hypothetical protein